MSEKRNTSVVGKLIRIGTMEVGGETITGALIAIPREALKVLELKLYESVVVESCALSSGPPVQHEIQVLPCTIPCPKCGSVNVARSFFHQGEHVTQTVFNKRKRETEFVFTHQYQPTAKKDCIVNHCRVCDWDWEVAPLDVKP